MPSPIDIYSGPPFGTDDVFGSIDEDVFDVAPFSLLSLFDASAFSFADAFAAFDVYGTPID